MIAWEARAGTVNDLESILQVVQLCAGAPHWPRPVWERVFAAAAAKDGHTICMVGMQSGQLAGFAVMQAAAGVGEIQNLAVHPLARRRGVAKQLCRLLLRWAEAHELQKIELELRSNNEAARALYEGLGFREEGTRRQYYHAPADDAILMGLALRSQKRL